MECLEKEHPLLETFNQLDSGLRRKGKIVDQFGDVYDADFLLRAGQIRHTVKWYEFGDGLLIAREEFDQYGSVHIDVHGYARYGREHDLYNDSSVFYYIYDNGVLVADKEKAKYILLSCASVDLPELAVNYSKKIPFSSELEATSREVVTMLDPSVGKEPDGITVIDNQPDDDLMISGLKRVVETTESLKDEFGLGGLEMTLDRFMELRRIASELVEKHRDELPPWDRTPRKYTIVYERVFDQPLT